jgi:hypothetical protein
LIDKFSTFITREMEDDPELQKPPLIQLTILCDHVFDMPIQSSMIPLSQYELAVVEILGRLDDILYSRKSLNLSEGLSFSIEVVDAPQDEDDYQVAPPIRGGGNKRKMNDEESNSATDCWLPQTAGEEEEEEDSDEYAEVDEEEEECDYIVQEESDDESIATTTGMREESDDESIATTTGMQEGDFYDDDDDEEEALNEEYFATAYGCGQEEEEEEEEEDGEWLVDDDGDSICSGQGGQRGRGRRQRGGRNGGPGPRLPAKRPKCLTKVLVEPDRSILSLTWSDSGSVSEEWARSERGLFPLPSFRDDKELNGCCLLVAIVAGLALSQELKVAKSWAQVQSFPQTENWKSIYLWKSKRTLKAAQNLGIMTKRFARLHKLDLNAFKSGNVLEAGRNPQGLLNVPVNFNLYHRAGAEQRFFAHPAKYQPKWPTVHILVLPSDEGITRKFGGGNDGDVRNHFELFKNEKMNGKARKAPEWHAAALIINPSAYLHKHQGRSCSWCGRAYKKVNFATHRCPLPPPRRRCGVCKRPQLLNRDFIGLIEREDRCDAYMTQECEKRDETVNSQVLKQPQTTAISADGKPQASGKKRSRICPQCKMQALTPECASFHLKRCKKDGYFRCTFCGERARKGSPPHLCDHLYCLHCKVHYTPEAEKRIHSCYITPASPPATVDHIAVWDTETTCGNMNSLGSHSVNAVGLAFEKLDDPRGQWSEIYFYSDDLNHPQDGILCENTFSMDYLPKNCPATAKPKTAARPKSKGKLAQYKRAGTYSIYDVQEEEEEGRDSTALDKFLNFILQPKFAYYTFIAHYGQAFDCILLLNRLLKRQIQCEPIFEGNKAILIRLPQFHMRFVDSHRYIKSPLEKFPNRFPQISSLLPLGEAAKGVFPYKFNRPENYSYVGPVPDKSEFVDDFASSSKVAKVEKFLHDWPSDKVYNFQNELHLYLQADVKVLMAGVSCLLQEFYTFQAELQMTTKDEEKKFFPLLCSTFSHFAAIFAFPVANIWHALQALLAL